MSLKIGLSEISNVKAGSSQVNKIYLGTNLVWEYSTGSSFDADYQAILDYADTQLFTKPSSAQQTAGNQLVLDLKSANLWNKFDVLYIFATDGDSDFACINWRNPGSFDAVKVSSPIFSSSEGFGSNGAGYLKTGWSPGLSGSAYTVHTASIGFYERIETNTATINMGVIGPGSTNVNRTFVRPRNTGQIQGEVNANRYTTTYPTTTSSLGWTHIDRPGINTLEFVQNGVVKGVDTSTAAVTGSVNDMYIMCCNYNNNPLGGSISPIGISQLSFAYMAASMSGSYGTLNSAFRDYLITLGVNVI